MSKSDRVCLVCAAVYLIRPFERSAQRVHRTRPSGFPETDKPELPLLVTVKLVGSTISSHSRWQLDSKTEKVTSLSSGWGTLTNKWVRKPNEDLFFGEHTFSIIKYRCKTCKVLFYKEDLLSKGVREVSSVPPRQNFYQKPCVSCCIIMSSGGINVTLMEVSLSQETAKWPFRSSSQAAICYYTRV